MEIRELVDRLKSFGGTTAIIHQDQPIPYSKLVHDIQRYTEQLAGCGVESGDVVALEGDFSPTAIAMLISIWSVEAVAMPITLATKERRERYLEISRCRWECKADSDSPEINRLHLENQDENDLIKELKLRNHPGLILFTSGTTAEPKAVLHDSTVFLEKFRRMKSPVRTLAFLMFDHMGGVDTLFYSLTSGGQLITLNSGERGADEVSKAIELHRIELLPTSPTFLNFLIMSEVHDKYNLSSIKRISYGTEPMPESTLTRLIQKFPEVTFAQSYGTSELGVPRAKSLESGSTWIRVGGEGFETRVVDGQLEVRSKSAMMGYLNAPSPFDNEGWYATGDAVETDQTGEFYRILGRTSDLINVGGEKVAPAEVESVLLGAENVADVMVVSASNPLLGKMVVARVVLKIPETLVELSRRLRAFCQGKLANYKIPVKFEIVNQLERTSSGKKLRDISRE